MSTASQILPPSVLERRRATGASVLSGSHVGEIQRARLLAGALRAVDDLGYTRATVTDITDRARVSRRTFYELFANYEACVLELLDTTVAQARAQLATAGLDGLSWRERVRGGLWTILCLLERERALARVCVVQSAQGGPGMLERRERVFSQLAGIVDRGRSESARGRDCSPLVAEGVVGAAFSILHSRLSRDEQEPLTDLYGELMGMIVLPYLGAAAARTERKHPTPTTSVGPNGSDSTGRDVQPVRVQDDPFANVRIRVTHRTICVLEALARQPGLSNRQAGDAAGITDQGQISKLLARLEHRGLLQNTGQRARGEANSWALTPTGEQVTQIIGIGTHDSRET